jgi:hypothetical protein
MQAQKGYGSILVNSREKRETTRGYCDPVQFMGGRTTNIEKVLLPAT